MVEKLVFFYVRMLLTASEFRSEYEVRLKCQVQIHDSSNIMDSEPTFSTRFESEQHHKIYQLCTLVKRYDKK